MVAVILYCRLCTGFESLDFLAVARPSRTNQVNQVSQERRVLTEQHASVGEAVDEALRGGAFPPPDWLRLSTIAKEEAAQRVAKAVFAISEGLRLEQKPILHLRQGASEAAQALALWVPPRSMLLVSSMMGEALGDEPMILVENLDLEGEETGDSESDAAPQTAQFYRGSITGLPLSDLTSLAQEALKKRFVATVELDEANEEAVVHTTASGKVLLETWMSREAMDASTTWAAVGGNSEYLGWVASEVMTSETPLA